MNRRHVDEGATVKTEWGEPAPGPRYAKTVLRTVRRGLQSGGLAGVGGGVILLGGVRALARGDARRGLVRLLVGGLLLAVAAVQRGSTGGPAGERIDVEEPEEVTVEPTESAGTHGTAEYERLGAAAFDEHGAEVPAPQPAFDREFLALGDEAYWGIREADDAVVVTQQFDPLREREDLRYVASSEVDDARTLSVPDTVLNHWDEVAGGGTAVVSGTDIVFLVTGDRGADGFLLVVPEQWADDLVGSGEE